MPFLPQRPDLHELGMKRSDSCAKVNLWDLCRRGGGRRGTGWRLQRPWPVPVFKGFCSWLVRRLVRARGPAIDFARHVFDFILKIQKQDDYCK